MDEPALWPASLQCLLERVDDELGAEVVLERPADDAAAVAVDDHAEVEPALPRAQVGDVRDPEPVRCRRLEVALDEIIRDTHSRDTNRRPAAAPFDRAADARLSHQPLDALTTDGEAVGAQVPVDARRAVGATAESVQLTDPLQERLISDRSR
jgi:hypothetical protein